MNDNSGKDRRVTTRSIEAAGDAVFTVHRSRRRSLSAPQILDWRIAKRRPLEAKLGACGSLGFATELVPPWDDIIFS